MGASKKSSFFCRPSLSPCSHPKFRNSRTIIIKVKETDVANHICAELPLPTKIGGGMLVRRSGVRVISDSMFALFD